MSSDFVLIEGGNTANLKSFYICTHPVTQEEYQKVIGLNPSDFKNPKNPVEQVSWYSAVEYCNIRSKEEGLECVYYKKDNDDEWQIDWSANGYRLPTSAEWEWVAKGGNKSKGYKYAGSDNIEEVTWCKINSNHTTHPIMQKKPNELGIYDMSGNAWEWCWDTHNGASICDIDNRVWKWSEDTTGRVVRGGAWLNSPEGCGVSITDSVAPLFFDRTIGFRLVMAREDLKG